MTLTATDREARLSQWIKPSSDDEKTQQDRAERMVREAITASSEFTGSDVRIYTKGSYPNNTNVRRDSDVDVVVALHDCQYYDYVPGSTPATHPYPAYQGRWDSTSWRVAVHRALIDRFGSEAVTGGKIALNVSAVTGSRPGADVVPSFAYVRYDDAQRTVAHDGTCVFPSDGSARIVNWPAQQLANGQTLNTNTGHRYKNFVRALKNAENTLVDAGVITDLPSYFIECLVFNVPAASLTNGNTFSDGFRSTLVSLWNGLDDGTAADSWEEPNKLKWLFRGQHKWSVDDAKKLVLGTWDYLGYGNG